MNKTEYILFNTECIKEYMDLFVDIHKKEKYFNYKKTDLKQDALLKAKKYCAIKIKISQ